MILKDKINMFFIIRIKIIRRNFINMFDNLPSTKYKTWYLSIIDNARRKTRKKSRENYFESHHIIPKCLGGKNNKENRVLLTAKEHYIVHCLLVKMYEKVCPKIYAKMVYSLHSFNMCCLHKRYMIPSSKVIKIREQLSSLKKGKSWRKKPHTIQEIENFKQNHWTKTGHAHPLLGKNHTRESKNKMSDSNSKNTWKARDPSGKEYIFKSATRFCQENNLSLDAFILFKNKGPIPHPTFRAKKTVKDKRLNIIGWSFNLLS